MAEPMMPPQGGAPAPEGKGSPQDQFTDLVSNITDGMSMLTDVMGSVNPDAAAKLGDLSEQFKAAVAEAMGGGGAVPAQQGMVSAQTGGAKAVPASPAGIPRG